MVGYLIPYLQADAVGGDKQVDRVQTVERHIGQFDKPDDVKRWLTNRDGGVRVAAMRIVAMRNEGSSLIGTIEFAAFVFTTMWLRQRPACRGDRRSLGQGVNAQGRLARNWCLQVTGCRARRQLVVAVKSTKLGLAIWSVTWRQVGLAAGYPIDSATLDDFLRCHWQAELG